MEFVTTPSPHSISVRTGPVWFSTKGCSNTEGSHLNQTTCFWVITLIEVNSHWKQFAYCLPTRSNTPRTSSCCEGTTSVRPSTEFTDFTTNVKGATTSNYGKPSPTVSTVCPWPR